MGIQELTEKIKESSKKRTHTECVTLLKNAHIIDSEGYYSSSFFSSETVEKDRKLKHSINV
ncbi:hypothetical protein EW093_07525 [Thiospirochaeta perfilievii]|uniref:Uncharacterized protein n=1 Tax=Thiospirochaeta perfilievii TaxID=252967 RepID=A0A5C1QAQ2_9SPIO|nr:hypothetical protein [Thiospirochaeta perfilievii]QEN04557.1 hypothetical protein EW093_07525 [Thiospirochaeta perfilievii]